MLVVLLTTGLLGVSALAIYFAQIYTGINELQTAVDAAALHGARVIQKTPSSDVVESVKTFANTYNGAFGAAIKKDEVTVRPYHYEEADPSKNGSLSLWTDNRLNAVQASITRSSGPKMLGGFLKWVVPSPTRTATAWVANLTGNSCVRPWGFAIGYLINRANSTVANNVERGISFSEMATLRNNAPVRFVLAPPGTTPTTSQINNTYGRGLYGGQWAAFDFSDNGSATSVFNTCSSNAPLVEGAVANATSVAVSAVGNSLDKDQGGGTPVCSDLSGSMCLNNGSTGGPVAMTFAYNTTAGLGSFGSSGQPHRIERVGSFVLECFRRPGNGPPTACAVAGSYPNVNWNNVATGTILGYLDFSVPSFSGAYSLGAGAGSGGGTQQRLILVNAPVRTAPAP